jgi:hypothetical protein
MRRITPDSINPQLVSKNFAPIPESEFRKTIDDIIQNKEKFQKFYTNYLYSVGTGRTENIVPA